MSVVRTLTCAQAAYIAGIVDGEGTITLTRLHSMKCPICRHGETRPGRATVTLERGGTTLVFKDVPADVCGNCGDALHSEDVTRALLSQAEQVARAGVEVNVRRYAAT